MIISTWNIKIQMLYGYRQLYDIYKDIAKYVEKRFDISNYE